MVSISSGIEIVEPSDDAVAAVVGADAVDEEHRVARQREGAVTSNAHLRSGTRLARCLEE
jgi:hypothetical protein